MRGRPPRKETGEPHADDSAGKRRVTLPADRARSHESLWGRAKPVVGVVHLLPLPGSPRWNGSMDLVLDRALQDAIILSEGGLDGLLVENFGDAPFFPHRVPAETVAAMAVAVREIVKATGVPVGVNVLRNDAEGALAVAASAGARFIRVNVHTGSMFTDQGLLDGRAHLTLRKRTALKTPLSILADALVKHAHPPPGVKLAGAARDCWFRGLADGIVLTGAETGMPIDPGTMEELRGALPPEAKLWVGSGATADNAIPLMEASDGLIVGSALQTGSRAGGGVETPRVHAFMKALGRI